MRISRLISRCSGSVARRAFFWSWLIKEDDSSRDLARHFMAPPAWCFAMRPLQRESGAGIVIEYRRPPVDAGMTIGTGGGPRFRELSAMNVPMARLALGGRRL